MKTFGKSWGNERVTGRAEVARLLNAKKKAKAAMTRVSSQSVD